MSQRDYLLNVTVQLVTEECANCHVLFAIPDDMRGRLMKSHGNFWCPNGHSQHYLGETAEEAAKKKLAETERRLASRLEDLRAERMSHEATQRQLSAAKGRITKVTKRIERGVCIHCRRSFVDVSRHMHSQHADVVTP